MTSDQHKVLLTFLFLFILFSGNSQQPLHFDRIGRNEGLSQSSVNCMLRDRDGFVWFGTQDGLNMYDGKKFRVFQNQPGDPSSLSNNYIVSICEDEEGLIWVGTMTGGLNRFDKHTEKFRTYTHSDSLNSISENTVWTVLSDGDGNIWCGTSLGLNRLDKKTGQFKTFRPVPSDPESLVTDLTVSLFQDRQGRLWVGTVEGLCLLDKQKEKFERYFNPLVNELSGANIIWSVSETMNGEIITGTDNGVYLLDPGKGSYKRILGKPGDAQLVAWSLTIQQNNTLWIGSDRGLFRIAPDAVPYDVFLHDPSDPNSITDNNIWCLLPDPSGFLWAGTNNGISKTKTSSAGFRLLTGDEGQDLRLSSSRIMAILEDRAGNLWIGTDGGGLNCIGPDRKSVRVYNSANSGLRNDNVWALAEDSRGNLFIGNYQGGLHQLDKTTGTIHAYPLNAGDPYSLANRRVLALLAGKDGTVWIGTRGGGLCRLDPEKGLFKSYSGKEDDLSGFPSVTVLSLAQDTMGRIWAGTHEGGLALYLPSSDHFQVFKNIPGDPGSLSDNSVWAIEFDSKGRLWAGTQGGLNYSDNPGENLKFRYFTIQDGLRSNIILGIKEGEEGNFWISSFSGIARLNSRAFESYREKQNIDESLLLFDPLFTLFDTDHGLQGLEFNQGSSHKGYSGTIYFGGNKGLNYFSDDEVKASDYVPPVVITGFRIFNREVGVNALQEPGSGKSATISGENNMYSLPVKITYLDELTLTYTESVFSFEFASLDYLNPHKNQYAYKMKGFDADWNFMGTQNTATYTNLDPGEYTLLIRGSNSDGVWNHDERALKIIIVPPFWKTSWFISIVAFIVLLIIFLFLRSIFISQKRKAEREKEMIELQLKTIKSQIDPHFAFNAINTIASFIFSEKPEITYDYFTRFARMMRNILEDNEKISRLLTEEIEFVRNYLELQKMRFRDKFEYSIDLDERTPAGIFVPKMIIQSYAENSIKHGLMHRKSGGTLKMVISYDEPVLKLIIEDNGIGREKAAQMNPDTTRRGFRIMQRTIELYSKLYQTRIEQEIEDLKDEAGKAAGTRVILTINSPGGQKAESSSIFKLFKNNG